MIYLHLFWEFFQTGLFAVGGGMATFPFLTDLADKTGWYTQLQLADMIAISESTPGPIMVNMATYIGSDQAGFLGSLVATVGVVLPAYLVIVLIVSILGNVIKHKYVQAVLRGLAEDGGQFLHAQHSAHLLHLHGGPVHEVAEEAGRRGGHRKGQHRKGQAALRHAGRQRFLPAHRPARIPQPHERHLHHPG